MPRSRGSSEMSSQRQSSPRVPLHLKTTAASEANSLPRFSADRSSSPRPISLHEKKRATKVKDQLAVTEAKLGEAQEELKKVKDQLALTEAAKRDFQQQLEETKKQIPVEVYEEPCKELSEGTDQQTELDSSGPEQINWESTDVFEILPAFSSTEPQEQADREPDSCKVEVETTEEDVSLLKARLTEKEKELEQTLTENDGLKKQVAEASEKAAAVKATAGEMGVKLHCMEVELGEKRAESERLKDSLETAEERLGAAEAEMKRVKAQAEQWRKAAEAAAAVLAGDGERIDRCVSMEKNNVGGYGGGWSPVAAENGGGKRRGGGIRMFGDLWKKKGQHSK